MDSSTLISLFSISIGFLSGFTLLCMKLLFKSKCSEVDIGCIKIKRNVESEVQCERLELSNVNNNINNNNTLTARDSNVNLPVV